LLVENLNDGIVISQNDKFTFINKQFAGLNRIDHKSLQVANLYNAYLLLDRYKVKICVENKLDKSTSFYLKIPVSG
jgi:hypothetical protein